MWIVVRAFLGGALKGVWTWLSHRSFWQIVSLVLALALAVQTMRLWSEQRHATKVEKQLSETVAAREADRAAYVKAQSDAAAKNKAHVAATEAQSKRITDDTQSAYARDLAELVRLRQQARAAKGSASGASPSTPPAPANGADADGLQLSPDEHLQAQEIELRLMHLQNWVEQQLGIDPNK